MADAQFLVDLMTAQRVFQVAEALEWRIPMPRPTDRLLWQTSGTILWSAAPMPKWVIAVADNHQPGGAAG